VGQLGVFHALSMPHFTRFHKGANRPWLVGLPTLLD
jgi:hypothetical protein